MQKEILKELEIDFDESNGSLLDLDAQDLLNKYTKGISTYSIEMLRYGYNVDIQRLKETDRATASEILNFMVKEHGHTNSKDRFLED